MVPVGSRLDTTLPFGLIDGRGRRHRAVSLVPIIGEGELLAADEPNLFRASLLVLGCSLKRLGPYQGEEIMPLLPGLLALDRDYLLIQLNRLTFGNVQFQTVICPAEECGARMDIQLDLSTISADRTPSGPEGRVDLADGSAARFRLPTVADQIWLQDLHDAELETGLLHRCLLPPAAEVDLPTDQLLAASSDVRTRLTHAILEASCNLELDLDLECISCRAPFRYEYDPVSVLLGRLRANRRNLLREVHYLAFYYHWSRDEILRLSRTHRREFLELLEEELGGSREGLAI